jgi:hypothetical protein
VWVNVIQSCSMLARTVVVIAASSLTDNIVTFLELSTYLEMTNRPG